MQSKLFIMPEVEELLAPSLKAQSKNTKARRRRYYLHRKCKEFVLLSVKAKTFLMQGDQPQYFTDRQKHYINELCNNYGYSIQTMIQ